MFRSVVSTKATSTSGLEKMSRLKWVASLGIMCAAVVFVIVLIFMREANFLTVKANIENCQSFCVFESFLFLLSRHSLQFAHNATKLVVLFCFFFRQP